MEETNYHRDAMLSATPQEIDGDSPPSDASTTDPEKAPEAIEDRDVGRGHVEDYRPKSFLGRMKLFELKNVTDGPRMTGMFLRPLIYFSFPVIFFSGFMYGSILVWFNVLNGTSSLILSGEPYNFRSSMVGLSYLSCLIGVFIGCVDLPLRKPIVHVY